MLDLNEIEEHGLGSNANIIGGGGLGSTDDVGEQGGYSHPQAPNQPPALGLMKLSPDQRMLACTIDVDGSDRFVLAVFDLSGDGGTPGGGGGCNRRRGPKVSVLREDTM